MNGGSKRNGLAGLMLLAGLAAAMAPPASAQDAEPRKIERDGLKLETAPLQPDQIRAFFMGRGFNAADADFIVQTGCVFRSSIGSSFETPASPEVTVALNDWRVIPAAGAPSQPKLREDWAAIWKKRGAGEDAALAFYWALFPSAQTFAATDYNWGFLTFGLPPGTRFSLELRWRTGAKTHVARLENLQCGR